MKDPNQDWYVVEGTELTIMKNSEFENSSAYFLTPVEGTSKLELAEHIWEYASQEDNRDWLENAIQSIHDFDNEVEFHLQRMVALGGPKELARSEALRMLEKHGDVCVANVLREAIVDADKLPWELDNQSWKTYEVGRNTIFVRIKAPTGSPAAVTATSGILRSLLKSEGLEVFQIHLEPYGRAGEALVATIPNTKSAPTILKDLGWKERS
jgi:hypothetical protein